MTFTARQADYFQNLPPEMKARDAWVTYKAIQRPGRSKPDKPPLIAGSNVNASSTNPYTWRSFAEAERAVRGGRCNGLGYCLEGSELVGADFDHVRTPATGQVARWA